MSSNTTTIGTAFTDHLTAQRQRNAPMGHSVLPPTFIAMLGNRIAAVYFRRPLLPDDQFATNTHLNGNEGAFWVRWCPCKIALPPKLAITAAFHQNRSRFDATKLTF